MLDMCSNSLLYLNCLPPSVVCWKYLQTAWTQIRPDILSGLIWIQTLWRSDGIPERIFRKVSFWKNQQTTKEHEKLPSMQCVKRRRFMIFWYLSYKRIAKVLVSMYKRASLLALNMRRRRWRPRSTIRPLAPLDSCVRMIYARNHACMW